MALVIKKTSFLFALLGLSACSGGVISDPKAQSRSLHNVRLPAPADLGAEKEETVMLENGVGRTTVKFKKQSQLRLGAESELGLKETSLTVPAGQFATVISRVTMNNEQEYFYVALHNPLSVNERSGINLSDGDLKISEGYVVAGDVEEVATQETGKSSTTPSIPNLSQASCSVNFETKDASFISNNPKVITNGLKGRQQTNVSGEQKNPLAVLSGRTFRDQVMDSSSVVVTLDGLSKTDISSVKFQLELDTVTNGASRLSIDSKLCDLPKGIVNDSAQPVGARSAGASKAQIGELSREFARKDFNTCKKMPEFSMSSDKFTTSEANKIRASMKDLKITPNNWMGVRLNLNAKVLTAGSELICTSSQIQLISPLVMDFSGRDTIKTLSVLQSKVHFDLLGDGRNVRTGWIAGTDQALLALDINRNGKIDNGRELFGEATLLPGKNPAQNGFIALAQYDLNKDGIIDAKDKVFNKLMLWFDQNQDGVTDKGELKSLSEMGVTSIDLTYKKSDQANDTRILENNVALDARFNGPSACGVTGCKIYDVYFSTMSEESLAKK